MFDIIYFAKKYGFILNKDIKAIEEKEFCQYDYNNIHNKPFICYNDDETKLIFGKIKVETDNIDEEEWYYIEKKYYFTINITKEMNDAILITQCKKYNIYN